MKRTPQNSKIDARDNDRSPAATLTVVCPLRFEAAHIRRGLRGASIAFSDAISIICCGPGAAGIERFARAHAPASGATVILAGLAGSLDESLHAGQATVIDEVCGDDGCAFAPSLRSHEGEGSRISITASLTIVVDAEIRHALAQRTGANLVDLESVAFAKAALEHGWRWGIVRGVSDDLTTHMPANMSSWTTREGGTRLLPVALAVLRRPMLARDLRCLHHNSALALRNVSKLLLEILRRGR